MSMRQVKKTRIKLALIGCGNIAHFHIKAFKKLGINFSHCASSLNSKKVFDFAKKHSIKNIWNNPLELAKASHLWDGLILSSKTEAIPEILEILIKQKKPILVEKPVDIGTKYLKKFKNSCSHLIQVAYNRRFYSTVEKLKNHIESSKSKLLIKATIPEKVNKSKNKFIKFRHIFENSSHIIDLLFFLFKKMKIVSIQKVALNSYDSGRVIMFTTQKKHTGVLMINSNSPDNFSIEVDDGKIKVVLRPIENIKIFQGLKRKEPTPSYPLRRYRPQLIKSKNVFNSDKLNKKIKPGFYGQSISFIKLISENKRNISANLTDAYNAQKFIEKIMLS